MLEEDRKREIQEKKDQITGRIWRELQRPDAVKMFGGGELGERVADFFDEIEYGPSPPWGPVRPKREVRPLADSPEKPKDQTESNQIKPRNQWAARTRSRNTPHPLPSAWNERLQRPDPTESDLIRLNPTNECDSKWK